MQFSEKNKRLFKMVDEVEECSEEITYYASRINSKERLDNIVDYASKLESVAREIQEHVKTMRRKKEEV
jgi:Na+/phosphate symporter